MKFLFLFILFVVPLSWGQTSNQKLDPVSELLPVPVSDQTFVSTAQIQGFTITSDSLSRDLEKGTVFLQGNVKVIYQNQFFEAEQMEINLKTKQAHLVGNVKIQAALFSMSGREVKLDYEANQGLIFYGSVQSNNIRFQGDIIEKLSDTEFYVSNADYTTCSNCPSTWSFDGSKIKAELGGYAYLKNTFLRLGGVPIFWFPYLVIPLKSVRQSGLLTPEISYIQDRNLAIAQSGFWAISRSQDATFTLKNYEIGGVKPLVEYRYAINQDSFGTVNTAFIHDALYASQDRYNTYRQPSEKYTAYNRWALRSYNQYSWDANNKLQLRISTASDLQYPKDFSDEFKNYSESSLENRLTYSHFTDHTLTSVDSSYYKNLLQADPLSSNNNSVHKFPEVRFDSTYLRVADLPLYYKVDSSYTRFYRNKPYDDIGTYTDPTTGVTQRYVTNESGLPNCENSGVKNCNLVEDGVFNEGTDIMRTGQRALLKASLTTDTYNLANAINLSPTFSYHEAQYFFDVGEERFSSRRYVQFDLNTRTKFHNIYDEDYSITGKKYKNEIIPEIQYSWIPWVQSQSHSFFGSGTGTEAPYSSKNIISDNDVNTPGGVLYDYEDRVYDRHIISVSILDRLVRKKREDNTYKTVVSFRVTQSYDLYQAQYGLNRDQPLSDLSGTLLLDLDQIQSYSQVNYFPYLKATNSTTSLSFLNDQQQYFKIGLTSKRTEPKQDDISLAIGFVSTYVNVLTGVIFDASADRDNGSRLKKFSLITQLKPPGECWVVNFYRDQKVGSSTNEWKLTFDFSFDGKPTKVIPPAELNIN
ncbi:MAG: LPS assembly protein LptD [Bdellovibrio sp.]|nr:LPS assembly protein LptD [Bdellovibrio sp.]